VLQAQSDGAVVLDGRDSSLHSPRHLKGSINIGLGGSYATWAGTVLDRAAPIVILTSPGCEYEAALRLGRIGFDQVVGYLENGIDAVTARPDRIGSATRLSPAALHGLIESGDPPFVIDVRTRSEREAGYIRNSVHIPLNRLSERINEVPPRRSIVVYCRRGYRSSIAASLLRRQGFPEVTDLAEGIAGWVEAGMALASLQKAAR
jgi:rhodanese-related sulfurtransferase